MQLISVCSRDVYSIHSRDDRNNVIHIHSPPNPRLDSDFDRRCKQAMFYFYVLLVILLVAGICFCVGCCICRRRRVLGERMVMFPTAPQSFP